MRRNFTDLDRKVAKTETTTTLSASLSVDGDIDTSEVLSVLAGIGTVKSFSLSQRSILKNADGVVVGDDYGPY